MDNIARYAAVSTKARVLESKLLQDEDYINLLGKKTVCEVASYLKHNTHYNEVLEGINENEIHRAKLENLLKESHINGLKKLVHYFYDFYKKLFNTFFIRYEIEDLKIILRTIKTGKDNAIPKESFMYIGKVSTLDADTLLSSRNIVDFIKKLEGTFYYNYLRSFVERKDDISLFSVEMTLDLAYFDLFYKSIKSIGKFDKGLMEDSQGVIVDLLNLQWIYRGIKFFNLPPEELFNYTIAHGREFNREDIKEFCYSKNLDALQKRILGTKYSFLFDNENTRDIFMERRILRYQYFNIIRSLKLKGGVSISHVIVYALLREIEVRDIISIIENIRYGMPPGEAKKFLIRKL